MTYLGEAMRTEYAAQSLVGPTSHLPEALTQALDGAMMARLLRSAQEAGVTGEGLDLVQALLFYWAWASGEGRADLEHPLRFDAVAAELADLTGWPVERVRPVLTGLAASKVLGLHPVGADPWSRGEFAIDLTPLLARETQATADALRRLWSSRHFRRLHAAWRERLSDLEHLLAENGWAARFEGVEPLAEQLRERWRDLGEARNLQAIDRLFSRPWANSEQIYSKFTELVVFDDLAWPLTSQLGLLDPLSRVLHEQAGMRAQVRRDRALGYTVEPLN